MSETMLNIVTQKLTQNILTGKSALWEYILWEDLAFLLLTENNKSRNYEMLRPENVFRPKGKRRTNPDAFPLITLREEHSVRSFLLLVFPLCQAEQELWIASCLISTSQEFLINLSYHQSYSPDSESSASLSISLSVQTPSNWFQIAGLLNPRIPTA